MSQFDFLVSSHFEIEDLVTTWVIEFCQNLSLLVLSQMSLSQFFHHKDISTQFFQTQTIFSPFSFFTSNFVHHKNSWPLRPHSVQYPPGLVGLFSSPGYPSGVHDRVCSLKIWALCSASPALVEYMMGSNIFYCVLRNCDSVCDLFWYNINYVSLKTKKYTFYILLIVQILVCMWRQKGLLFIVPSPFASLI